MEDDVDLTVYGRNDDIHWWDLVCEQISWRSLVRSRDWAILWLETTLRYFTVTTLLVSTDATF